jgi:hypothetical protein
LAVPLTSFCAAPAMISVEMPIRRVAVVEREGKFGRAVGGESGKFGREHLELRL